MQTTFLLNFSFSFVT